MNNKFSIHCILVWNQIKRSPALLLLLSPIAIISIVIWKNIGYLITLFQITGLAQKVFLFIGKYLLPIFLVWGLIELIGMIISCKDEEKIRLAFSLDKGEKGPILRKKTRHKKSRSIIREWESPIPIQEWRKHRDLIEHHMNIKLVDDFHLGERRQGYEDTHIISMCSKRRKKPSKNGVIFDDEF